VGPVSTSQQSSDVKFLVEGLISSKKEETSKKEEENASRVDALLMELFPDRADLFRNSNNNNNNRVSGTSIKASQQQKSKKALGMVARLKVQAQYRSHYFLFKGPNHFLIDISFS